ncbi:hypothetical protein PR048_017420 [Dryococelus australis]|uniref:Uncharacterized protein n=1 Tax=Dryococelus australis TaxID=614101 RepID=A0ABQ9H9G0_9NEOP|nr:hypothetical protein PR048_017420 [Dryococelus australis]
MVKWRRGRHNLTPAGERGEETKKARRGASWQRSVRLVREHSLINFRQPGECCNPYCRCEIVHHLGAVGMHQRRKFFNLAVSLTRSWPTSTLTTLQTFSPVQSWVSSPSAELDICLLLMLLQTHSAMHIQLPFTTETIVPLALYHILATACDATYPWDMQDMGEVINLVSDDESCDDAEENSRNLMMEDSSDDVEIISDSESSSSSVASITISSTTHNSWNGPSQVPQGNTLSSAPQAVNEVEVIVSLKLSLEYLLNISVSYSNQCLIKLLITLSLRKYVFYKLHTVMKDGSGSDRCVQCLPHMLHVCGWLRGMGGPMVVKIHALSIGQVFINRMWVWETLGQSRCMLYVDRITLVTLTFTPGSVQTSKPVLELEFTSKPYHQCEATETMTHQRRPCHMLLDLHGSPTYYGYNGYEPVTDRNDCNVQVKSEVDSHSHIPEIQPKVEVPAVAGCLPLQPLLYLTSPFPKYWDSVAMLIKGLGKTLPGGLLSSALHTVHVESNACWLDREAAYGLQVLMRDPFCASAMRTLLFNFVPSSSTLLIMSTLMYAKQDYRYVVGNCTVLPKLQEDVTLLPYTRCGILLQNKLHLRKEASHPPYPSEGQRAWRINIKGGVIPWLNTVAAPSSLHKVEGKH